MDYILVIIIACVLASTLGYRLGTRRGRKESWMREYRRGYRAGYDRARKDLTEILTLEDEELMERVRQLRETSGK